MLICDDAPAVRALLRDVLREEPGIEVLAEADNGRDAIRLVRALRPDVAVVDLRMPHKDGLAAIPEISRASPTTGIVVFTGLPPARMEHASLAQGAHRYVQKGGDLGELFSAIREAATAEGRRRPAPRLRVEGPPVWREWLRRRRPAAL